MNISYFLGKTDCLETTLAILTLRLWANLTNYVFSTNVAGLGTTCDVTSGDDCANLGYYFVVAPVQPPIKCFFPGDKSAGV